MLIRTSTERPEVLDKGSVVIGGIKDMMWNRRWSWRWLCVIRGEPYVLAEDYADTNVSVKVVKLIQSYAKIVNQTVWLRN